MSHKTAEGFERGPKHHAPKEPLFPLSRVCAYCGAPKTCQDHYLAWAHSGVRYTLPACGICNQLLGDSRFGFLGDRYSYLEDRYGKYFNKILPYDYDRLVGESTGILQRQFKREAVSQKEVERRLKVLDGMASVLSLVSCGDLEENADALRMMSTLIPGLGPPRVRHY